MVSVIGSQTRDNALTTMLSERRYLRALAAIFCAAVLAGAIGIGWGLPNGNTTWAADSVAPSPYPPTPKWVAGGAQPRPRGGVPKWGKLLEMPRIIGAS